MATYTTNYGLHQWVPEDNFLRVDFNEDFQKIDTAIKSTETNLQANLNGQAARLDGEVLRLDGEISRVDGALTTAQQTLRNEFNSSFQSLNATLAALQQVVGQKLELVSGTFTGTAKMGAMTEQIIALGFQPKAVFTGSTPFHYSATSGYDANCVLIYPGVTSSGTTSWEESELSLTSNGFRVAGLANSLGIVFQYLALR